MLLRTIIGCAVLLATSACSSTSSCKTARDCAASERCVNLVCKASSATLGTVGDSCAATSECASGLTCDTTSGFPSGLCTASCASPATCAAGVCATLGGGATCAASCATDTDCRNGYGCCAAMGNACVPPAACVSAACARPIAASTLPTAQVLLHEAHHKTGDNVPFTVPAGTGSITIVQQAEIANLTVVYQGQVLGNATVPGVILKPDGSKAYDDNGNAFNPGPSPDGGVDPSGVFSYYEGDTPSTGAFTLPSTSTSLSAGIPAGNWRFQVNDYAYECATVGGCSDGGVLGNTYDVTVLAKPTPAAAATATLDLAFYIVADVATNSGQPLNATTAPGDASVKRMVSTFKSIYQSASITIGNVSFNDVPAAARARFGTHISADRTGPCDELDQMFLLSADHPGNTLNLFLVQNITQSKDTSGGVVVGIDGTIPGPGGFAGTVHSGAAVSLADLFINSLNCVGAPDLSCGADLVAFIAAHEAGHFLGLFHTSEADGRFFDPLTDTAKCPCMTCSTSNDRPNCATGGTASQPVVISANLCVNPGAGCGGGDNLMFWQLKQGFSQGFLSTQQGAIMRLNPAVQ